MTQPTAYTPTTDFSDEAASSAAGRTTVNATKLDTELANFESTFDETLTNLALIQRDDAKLRDGTVELHTLSAQVRAVLASRNSNPRGDWVTATAYVIGDIVVQADATYICSIAHTSGTFSTDLTADRWIMLMFAPSALSAAGVSNVPAGSISATTVQAAINELDGDVTALAATVAAIDEVPLSGATMTGPLVLSGDPSAALGAATKQYADNVIDGLCVCAGYFGLVSTTNLRLNRHGGKRIFIGGEWHDIPVAGALLSNSGLAANTVYRAYAFINAGVVTLEASTTARAADATFGHQIKLGDASRTLVGMFRTNSLAQFYDIGGDIGVLSYYNRRVKVAVRSNSGPCVVSGTGSYTVVTPMPVLNFLSWGEDYSDLSIFGNAFATSGAVIISHVTGVDGIAAGYPGQSSMHATNHYQNLLSYQLGVYSEGNHTLDARALVNTSSATIPTSGISSIAKVLG